jgi:hypothetical protein
MIGKLPKVQSVFGKAGQSGIPALSSSVGDAHCDDPAKKSPLQRPLALGRTLHPRTQTFEPPSLRDHSFEAEQNTGEKKQNGKARTK